jgi:hypothetical protein
MVTISEVVKIDSIYETILQKVLSHPLPTPEEISRLRASTNRERSPAPDLATHWIGLLDLAVTPHLLRTYALEHQTDEAGIRALIRFLAAKPSHTQEDRDKIDWLATHFFKLREERDKQPTAWPRADLMEILSGIEFPGLSRQAEELLMEMPALLDEVKFFRSFSEITDSHIIQRARDLKNQFGDEFFHVDVLTAIVNYNLIFGKQFHALFQESIRQVQSFAKSDQGSAPDEKQLLATDYRLTGEAFSSIGNLIRSRQSADAEGSSQPQSPEQQLKQLGVDAEQEALYLKSRIEELLMRIHSNPGITTVPNSFAPLMLDDWEVNAMRNPYPHTEQSFRADFSRNIAKSIAIVYRIYEEIPQFLEKKSTEFLWKRHYDSLVYLLYEGRNQKQAILQLASSAASRGLSEKAKQLHQTANKLETGLGKVAELF